MRVMSPRARQALYAPETSEVFLALLVVSHPTIVDGPLRFANNMEDVYSTAGGEATPQHYLACPFTITLPEETSDKLPEAQIAIDNVDQRIVEAVRTMQTPPTMTLYLVLASTPDIVEAGPFVFTLKSAQYNATQVTGILAFTNILNEPFPWRIFNPADWPGVFA
jgi:hypothetical protein